MPLVESEALTIHKSQGQTYKKVAVHIDPLLNKALLYVAMSRVTNINGLFLFGPRKSILSEKKSLLSKEKRLNKVEKSYSKDVVKIEMDRLRKSCQMRNYFQFLEYSSKQTKNIKFMFHDCGEFEKNVTFIKNDSAFKQADILLLSTIYSCNTKLNIEDYILLSKTERSTKENQYGQLCFIKKDLLYKFSFVADNSNVSKFHGNSKDFEMSIFKLELYNTAESLNICHVFKQIKMDNKRFYEKLSCILLEHFTSKEGCLKINEKLILIGNFNMNFNNMPRSLSQISNDFGLSPVFLDTATHNSSAQLDWCFTNINPIEHPFESKVYECFFSEHSPLWLNIQTHKNNIELQLIN